MIEGYRPTIENKETESNFDQVLVYVFRHGKTDALEWQHQESTGLWDPEMDDLTEEGHQDVEQSAGVVSQLVDPQKQVMVMLSSPRARTMTTSKIIETALAKKGAEFYHDYGEYAPRELAQFLRSRGDFSNVYNSSTKNEDTDYNHIGNVSQSTFKDRERKNTGWRMLEFLNYCAEFFPKYFDPNATKPTFDPYGGKQPVLFLVTHNEVVADFLEKLKLVPRNPGPEGTMPKGEFFRIACDLRNAGHFTIDFPDPKFSYPTAEFYIDPSTGEAINDSGGSLSFQKGEKRDPYFHIDYTDQKKPSGL